MLLSDGVGLVAALLLAKPAVYDQAYRLQQARQTRRARGSPVSSLRLQLAQVWKEKREGYDGFDALCTAAGTLLLLLTFFLKLIEL
jgi:hypothetical protein